MRSEEVSQPKSPVISTPDQRLRVFVSSTLSELKPERDVARSTITTLRLTPVMFELGARPHPPANVYRSYLDQSDVFVGIYWQSYGWVAPDAEMSGLADEYHLSAGMPRLLYVKEPAPQREKRLMELLGEIRTGGDSTYRTFSTPEELGNLLVEDLAALVTERFHSPDAAHPGSGTLTFMFADLEGSTGILRRLGEDYQRVLGTYHHIVHEAVSAHHGHVVTTEGDGFFCVFANPIDAVDTAHQVQLALGEQHWPGAESPRCRIGIHTGTATRTTEGYVGIDVHVAARIGAAAQGGQVILSTASCDLVVDHVHSKGWMVVDLGHYELSGIGRSERLLRLDIPGLEVVRTSPRARPRTPSVVPSAPKRILGRDDDVGAIQEMLLRDHVRLVTLTGPGGTGKTRLAIELAHLLEDEFPDGIVFIDLSAVSDPERFLPVVGRALGVRESTERTIPEALHSVIDDAGMLFVLDNMEQILEASGFVNQLIEALPKVKILVTSRSPLRLAWENEYPVPPLSLPAEDADLDAMAVSGAVSLFLERTLAVRPYFELIESTREVVIDIVRRLDGLPLAIELAAARLRVFTVEELRDRLDHRLGVLDRGPTDAPARHRTLRSAIQWSHELLSNEERVVFRRLAVFAGGWTLEGAISVCGDDSLSETRVLDTLENLVARSLIVFVIDEEGRPRYRLLETLREFALEQLGEAGEEPATRLRHLSWCRTLAEQMMVILPTPEFPAFLDNLELERFNLREGLAWSVESQQGLDEALTICGMLPLFWDTRGYVSEGLRWLRALIAMTTGDGVTAPRAMAHTAMGWLEMLAGDADESHWAFSTAIGMFREIDDRDWLGRALSMAGMTAYNRGDPDTAEKQFLEAIELCREYGLDWLADGWCQYGLAHVSMVRGNHGDAEERLQRCLTYSRDHGLTWGIGHSQLSLGVLAYMVGDIEQSVARVVESMLVRRELRDSRGICDCLGMMALHASVIGDAALAATLLGAAEVAREASGDAPVPWLLPLLEQAAVSAETALGADYATIRERGRDLSTDEAVDLVTERFSNEAVTPS